MRVRILLAGMLASMATASAEPPAGPASAEDAGVVRIEIWPAGHAPDHAGTLPPQRIVDRGRLADGSRDRVITGVRRPYFVVHRPPHPDGTALLVAPGGGYERVVLDKEGTTLVPAFAGSGITLFVLRYRLPGDGHAEGADVALADAQRSLRMIRACAPAWGLDPARVGMLGFSAGGHLAASLGTRFDESLQPPIDAYDATSARPDFLLLGYPVIDMAGRDAHAGSRRRLLGPAPSPDSLRRYSPQHAVDGRTPPTFLLHASDDTSVPVRNSLVFHAALRAAGVPAELHVYAAGGHGFGTHAIADNRLAGWPRLAIDWIHSLPPRADAVPAPVTGCPRIAPES
ncbi:alpha/beta hydrolase [Luteimonas viscosa]|uniref:Alpha/beta hydrolase n=1 Tax=Luteimonas viscosa TaxID=1132694 RepID=A0A5D4XMS6_9GAMM|nr:alpha/beta hydrolase [Luteimonas viscosa]TYT25988.1 alpha/beta hydrolase [Luteimonas viscosa]